MGAIKKTRCRNCKCLFVPDHRNRNRQKYCKKAECRKASKAESQKKWLSKEENENYFSGSANVIRVQEWRKENPGYGKKSKKSSTLQDTLNSQPIENTGDNESVKDALQDSIRQQPPVIIGLIASFTGSTLQDNIAKAFLRMQQLGQDILYHYPTKKDGGMYDCKKFNIKASSA